MIKEYENRRYYNEVSGEKQDIWFLLILDKEIKKYYLQRTSYLDAFESIYLRKDKEHYAMMIFSNKFYSKIKYLINYAAFLNWLIFSSSIYISLL